MEESSSFVHWQYHLVSEARGCRSEPGQCRPALRGLPVWKRAVTVSYWHAPWAPSVPSHGQVCLGGRRSLHVIPDEAGWVQSPARSPTRARGRETTALQPRWLRGLRTGARPWAAFHLSLWRSRCLGEGGNSRRHLQARAPGSRLSGRSEALRARCDVAWARRTLRGACRIEWDRGWMPLLSAAGGVLDHLGLDFLGHQVRCSFWCQKQHLSCLLGTAGKTETTLYSTNEESLWEKGTGGRPGAGKSHMSLACECSMPAGQKGRAGDCGLMEVHPKTGWIRCPAAFKPCP